MRPVPQYVIVASVAFECMYVPLRYSWYTRSFEEKTIPVVIGNHVATNGREQLGSQVEFAVFNLQKHTNERRGTSTAKWKTQTSTYVH